MVELADTEALKASVRKYVRVRVPPWAPRLGSDSRQRAAVQRWSGDLNSADEFDAAEAYRIGLVQEVVEPGTQIERAVELAREMLQCAPLGLVHTIANARLALDHDEPTAIGAIGSMSATVMATADFQEGITSFVERRPAHFTGR